MISIIIPVFNQLAYTKECIDQIQKYTDIPYELIIIDNGSSDGTGEYLDTISAHVISNHCNRGVYVAWNQGIQASKTDHLIIMNNDILVTPHWSSALLQFSQKNPRRVVGPAMREGILNYPLIDYSERLTRSCFYAARMDELCNFSLVLFRRSFFDEVGLFDEQFFMTRGDDDMILRLNEKGIGTAVTGASFVHHYSEKTQENISSDLNIKVLRENDDRLFRTKWSHFSEKKRIRKLIIKFHDFFIPKYEKLRYGFPLKTPKPKNERIVNKV